MNRILIPVILITLNLFTPILIGDIGSTTSSPINPTNFDEDITQYLDDAKFAPATDSSIIDYNLTDYHGGTWCDAEKTLDDLDDDLTCWAAAASNVLEWTGWGYVVHTTEGEITNCDEMFEHFNDHWEDQGSLPYIGWMWWFNGEDGLPADYPNDPPYNGGPSIWSEVDVAGGGDFRTPPYNLEDYYHDYWGSNTLQNIDDYLHNGWGVALGIYADDGGHAITCWGFRYDDTVNKMTNPEDYYLGLYITDSDDNKWQNSWDPPDDRIRYYTVSYNSSRNRWEFDTYAGGGWYIELVYALEPFPNTAPEADANGPYTGDEGSMIIFDGSGSTDPDGNPLQYRWDFDNDGIWDTDRSSNPYTSYTYPDDYNGLVVLEVSDYMTTDTDTASVTVGEPTLSLDDVTTWYWTDNTTINSVVEGDVDYEGSAEVVTAGYYFDGERECAQLVVWDGSTLAVDGVTAWYWTNDTRINSVAIGNLDDDDALEIVTGGFYFDGARKVAQLVVWDGATLAVEGLTTWYWTNDTEINSVKIEDVDDDGVPEIITGGYYNDGVRDVAQLVVWNGTTFEVENLVVWYWTDDTKINSVDVENLDGDNALEIVTGGYYTDGRKIAQLVVWDGITLLPENIAAWYWISDTEISSVVAANVDADGDVEIVTGGYYNDFSRDIAQLVIWSSDLSTVENVVAWYWTSDTKIDSIYVTDADSDGSPEIITGGSYNDLSRDAAQLVVWGGSTLAVDYLTAWYWTDDTCICSVAAGNVDGDVPCEIITGGYFYDSTRTCAQTTIWEIS